MTENELIFDSNQTTCMDGWNAITEAFLGLYPNQAEPKHFAPELPYAMGGDDPLDGVSAYDGGDFWHFVSYGLSELYAKESEDKELSGMGFELTLKLSKNALSDEEAELENIAALMQSLAELCFEQEDVISPYEYIYTGQEEGVDTDSKSKICGFITLPDELGTISTPNGKLSFVKLIGVTNAELKPVLDGHWSVKDLADKLGSDCTDYSRKSLL